MDGYLVPGSASAPALPDWTLDVCMYGRMHAEPYTLTLCVSWVWFIYGVDRYRRFLVLVLVICTMYLYSTGF